MVIRAERGVGVVARSSVPLLDEPVERRLDAVACRGRAPRRSTSRSDDVPPRLRGDLGDARAHQAGTDDGKPVSSRAAPSRPDVSLTRAPAIGPTRLARAATDCVSTPASTGSPCWSSACSCCSCGGRSARREPLRSSERPARVAGAGVDRRTGMLRRPIAAPGTLTPTGEADRGARARGRRGIRATSCVDRPSDGPRAAGLPRPTSWRRRGARAALSRRSERSSRRGVRVAVSRRDVGAEGRSCSDEPGYPRSTWYTSSTSVSPSAHQPGEDQPGAGPDVGGPHRRAGEPFLAADDRVVAVGAHVGAEPDQLVDEHEPALEDVLGDHRRPVADRRQRDRQRLQVGREARVGQRHDVDRARAAGPSAPGSRRRARRPSRRPGCSLSSAISRCSGRAPRTVTSPCVMAAAIANVPATIRSGTVRCVAGMQRVDAVDLSVDVPTPPISRAHLHEHLAQVDDLRLAGGVVDDRRALGEDGGHQDVLGRADAREVEPDRGAGAALGALRDQVAVLAVERRPEPRQPGHVDVERRASRSRRRPGSATRAWPQRASSGPRTQIDAADPAYGS